MGFWSGFFGNNFAGHAGTDKGIRNTVGKKRLKAKNLQTWEHYDIQQAAYGSKTALALEDRQGKFEAYVGEKAARNEYILSHPLAANDAETTTLRNAGFTLAFSHVPTGREVEFKAFLDQISDAYTTNWNQESVYGRMDQIGTFQNTQRAIAVSWIVPAGSEFEAIDNMRRVSHLMQFMYPMYSDDGILASSPLLRLKFGNLIRDAKTGKGLLGYVNGFTVDPDRDAGWFAYSEGPMTGETELYPKALRLNCDFTVLHEHELGFKQTGNGYVFGRSSAELKTNPDAMGIDFPYPAGAGNPQIDGDNDIVRISANSHYSSDNPPVPGNEQETAKYKDSLLVDGGSVSSALRVNRYNHILGGGDFLKAEK
jgi:hypothetical protein